jgi:hypothetical protein
VENREEDLIRKSPRRGINHVQLTATLRLEDVKAVDSFIQPLDVF